MTSIKRLITRPDRSFFLFGPRGTGKSTWLKQVLPDAFSFDLLDTSLFLELSREPHKLEQLSGQTGDNPWIVLDEVQKIPALLDEVHRLMEARQWKFALCGSSARKLKRGGANLLAGRAVTRTMEGFSAEELGQSYDLEKALAWGLLPSVVNSPDDAADILRAYINTYLKEELMAEGIIRNVPPFLRFLTVAGMMNGSTLNMRNVAGEAAVSYPTAISYFSVLSDTLLAYLLPAWQPALKVREAAHPKFYWFDPGVARAAAGLLGDPPDRTWQGWALETLVYHEIRIYNEVSGKYRPVSYYATTGDREIDFIIETQSKMRETPCHVVAIEVKRSEKWKPEWEKPLLALKNEKKVVVDGLYGIYCGDRVLQSGPVEVLPVREFFKKLMGGQIY